MLPTYVGTLHVLMSSIIKMPTTIFQKPKETLRKHSRSQRLCTMSTSTAGKKRKVDVLEEGVNSAGQSTSGRGGEREKPSQG